MGKLTCTCLNVQIHCKTEPEPIDQLLLGSVKCRVPCDQFFSEQLSTVALNLEGIHVEHQSLVCWRLCSPWRVHECVNCATFTHALNAEQPDDNTVLVNPTLLKTEASVEDCTSCTDYSPVYKIVLKADADSSTAPVLELPSKEVQHEMDEIQSQLSVFLAAEENAMKERIRVYEETEREKFAALESKARSDKNVMMSRLLHVAYVGVSESLCEAMVESPVGSLVPVSPPVPVSLEPVEREEREEVDVSVEDDAEGSVEDDVASTLRRQPVSRSSSTSKRSRSELVTHQDFQPALLADDDVFQYDPGFQEDPSQPFSDSEDDINDTDDSSLVDDGIQRSSSRSSDSGRGAALGFSTSVPIDVPAWMGSSVNQSALNYHDDDDETDAVTRDPARMAASIRALARSVHGNTSEIFGELPRPPTRSRTTSQRTGPRR